MRKMSVDIHENLLERARELFGTSSIKQTIDTALREALRAETRRQEVRVLEEMDGLDLSNDAVMAKAWRA